MSSLNFISSAPIWGSSRKTWIFRHGICAVTMQGLAMPPFHAVSTPSKQG